MVKVTLDTFYQEFKDNQKYIIETLEEIKKQVKHTNGRVNCHDTDIALLKSNVENIEDSQEKLFTHGHSNRTFWLSVCSIVIAALTFILKLSNVI